MSRFESTGIYNLNPLAIPANASPLATAFDKPDVEVDLSENELPGDNHPVGRP